jgi:prepilin-type N-terminal cleavage/methylation domain-containing protein
MRSSSGFTLIEVLVTLTVLGLLSSLLIVYTRSSELQIRILKDKAALINAIYHARSLALNTYQTAGTDCGYGIYITDIRHYVVWRDAGDTRGCVGANKKYDEPDERAEGPIELATGISFKNFGEQDFLQSILFVPPDPTIITIPNKPSGEQFQLILGTQDGKSSTILGVNRFGQVEPAAGY